MKAREWLDRGNISEDPFDALSNYWRGFNNLFAGNGQERNLISEFIRSNTNEHSAQRLIDSHTDEIQSLLSEPVINMRHNGRNTQDNIKQYQAADSAVEKLVQLFMVIYQVRCNFEHGEKSPSRVRDITLCKSSCPLVAFMIEENS